jgi:predicted deacylase
VTFPPGRARLVTNPRATESPRFVTTTGIVRVACSTAATFCADGTTITSTLGRTRPAARSGSRSYFPSDDRWLDGDVLAFHVAEFSQPLDECPPEAHTFGIGHRDIPQNSYPKDSSRLPLGGERRGEDAQGDGGEESPARPLVQGCRRSPSSLPYDRGIEEDRVSDRDLAVAGVVVEPGNAVRVSLPLVEMPDASTVGLPLLLVNGAQPGVRLYLGAGIHGDEVNGVEILARVLTKLDPVGLAGSIVCVPVQNPLAFHGDHRIPVGHYLKSPLDQAPIDPWSTFPGHVAGNFAERLAATLFALITNCQYAIDCHTPTRGGRYPPITILPPVWLGEPARRAEEFALAFGAGYVMKTGSGFYVRDGILAVEATRVGVPTFTFEIGEGGRVEADVVAEGARCVTNALRHLGMLPGALVAPRETVRMKEFIGVRASRGGILHTEVRLGARVQSGDVLARTVGVYGDEVEVFRSPATGIFIRATTLSTVTTGERVATIALVE